MKNTRKICAKNIKHYKKVRKNYEDLIFRQTQAERKIISLQDEYEKLKNNRPILLAEKKSITKLNNRLNKIVEEIDINTDLIHGLKSKEKPAKWAIYNALCRAQSSYQDFIQSILNNLNEEYLDIGSKFAQIVKEYLTLERLRDGVDYNFSKFAYNFSIPNVKDEKHPLLCSNHSSIETQMNELVHEKYNIPKFQVSRIRPSEYE